MDMEKWTPMKAVLASSVTGTQHTPQSYLLVCSISAATSPLRPIVISLVDHSGRLCCALFAQITAKDKTATKHLQRQHIVLRAGRTSPLHYLAKLAMPNRLRLTERLS
jgi:hypothetical protein